MAILGVEFELGSLQVLTIITKPLTLSASCSCIVLAFDTVFGLESESSHSLVVPQKGNVWHRDDAKDQPASN